MTTFAHGILGGFPGDEERIKQVLEVFVAVQNGEHPGSSRLLGAFEAMPFSGRTSLVNMIATSSARDQIVSDLFDDCFVLQEETEDEVDDDFMLVSCGCTNRLNTQRVYVLKLLCMVIPRCGAVGVSLYKKYYNSTSTTFRSALLSGMVRAKAFTDDDLFDAFNGTVEAGKKTIINICKETPHRQVFIERLVDQKLAPVATLYWCSSETVKRHLLIMKSSGFTNFKQHFPVYLGHLEERFLACGVNKLFMGAELRKFEKLAPQLRDSEQIMALIHLCVKYGPLELKETRDFVVEHLQSLAKEGKLTDSYAGVVRALPEQYVGSLVQPHVILGENLVETPQGCVFKEDYKWLCASLLPRTVPTEWKALMVRCYEGLSQKEFWDNVLGSGEASKVKDTFKLVNSQLSWGMRQHRVTRDILDARIELHMKYLPSAAKGTHGRSDDFLWQKWFQSLTEPFTPLMANAVRRGKGKLDIWSKTGSMTGITSYFGYYRVLLERLVDRCLTPCRQHVDDASYLDILCNAIAPVVPYLRVENGPCIARIAAMIENLLYEQVVPMLGAMLDFDHSSKKYVTTEVLGTFWSWCSKLLSGSMFEGSARLREAMLSLMEEAHKKATLSEDYLARGFVECTAQDGTTSFVQLKNHLYTKTCSKALEFILAVVDTGKYKDNKQARSAWALWKGFVLDVKERHGGEWKAVRDIIVLEQGSQYTQYMSACARLGKDMLEEEKQLLVAIGKSAMQRKAFQYISSSFKSLGITLDVLNACDLDDATRLKWVLESQNVSDSQVREKMHKDTTQGDMHVRMAAHVALLHASHSTNLEETAASLKYVSQRIKNEAGLTRPQVYEWVAGHIDTLVRRSINDAVHIEALVQALDKMLRDDISKRDTVAKNVYVRISRSIINAALDHNPLVAKLEERKQWVVAAMNLHWLVIKNINGEEGWKQYCWEVTVKYPIASWLPEEQLERMLKPFLCTECRPYDYDLLREAFYSEDLGKKDGQHFLPGDAAELLVSALDEVKAQHYKLNTENTWLKNPSLNTKSDEGCNRVKMLMRYLGARWLEAPILVEAFKANFADRASLNFSYSLDLFNTARSLYKTSMWYELPVLRDAINALTEPILQKKANTYYLTSVQPLWIEAEQGQGLLHFGGLDEQQKSFLLAMCPSIKKKPKTVAEADAAKAAASLKVLTTARKLLGSCKSFIFFPPAVKALVSKRDDLLGEYIGVPNGELYGLYHKGKEREAKNLFNLHLTPADLSSTTGAIAVKYSTAALKQGMMRSNNTGSRSEAIVNYVRSPTTSHADVIELLKDLTAKSKGTDGVEADDSLTHIIESVVLSIFDTDAVWFILAYLLSPQVIASSPHRTTATILTNLTKWAPTSKVVDISGLLLNGSRRTSLSMFLHKQILRMLSDAGTPEAAKLFRSEWEQRVERNDKADIVKEMVKLAVQHLTSATNLSETAWQAAWDIAKNPLCVPDTTAILLLTTTWQAEHNSNEVCLSGYYQVPHDAVPRPTDEVAERHREFLVLCKALREEQVHTFQKTEIRDKFYSLLQTYEQNVQNEMLRVIVRVKKYTFCKPSVELLGEIKEHLMASGLREGEKGLVAPENFAILRLGQMYAAMVSTVLAHVMNTEKYTPIQKGQGVAIEEECKVNPYAQHMVTFLGALYDKLLDTPPRNVVAVQHLVSVTTSIKHFMQSKPAYAHIIAPHAAATSMLTTSSRQLNTI